MKPLTNYLLSISFFVLLITSCSEQKYERDSVPEHGKYHRIAELAEEEFMMTKNPETNTVPKEKLFKIRKSLAESPSYKKSLNDDDWETRGPVDVGGRTRAILIDSRDTTGNTLFVGSVAGGLWKCTNALILPTWERVEGYLGNPSICSMVQDPTNPEIMYIGTGEGWFNGDAYRGDGVYKSEDGGVTWNRLENTNNETFFYNQNMLITQEGVLLVATRGNGLLRSRDGGISWSIALNNLNQGFSNRMADIVSTPGGTLFASAGLFSQDGVYRSLDGGENWNFIELGIDSFERIDIAVSENDTNFVVLMIQDENTDGVGYIFTSDDNGDNWTSKTVPQRDSGVPLGNGQAWYDMSIAIDPNDSDVFYVGGVDLFKTVNGGDTWLRVSNWFTGTALPFVHADQHSAHYINGSSDLVYFTNDGGLFLTRNGSSTRPTFEDLSFGYVSTQYYACDIHPGEATDFYIGGSQDNGTELINNTGLSESFPIGGGDGGYCHIDTENPNIVVRSSQRGNYNVSRGPNFSNNVSFSVPGTSFFINPSDYDDVDKILYASSNAGEVHYFDVISSAEGAISVSAAGNDRASALTVDPIDNNILYCGTNNGRIIKITNPRSENTFSDLLFNRNGFVRNIDVDPIDNNRIICTYSSFGIESVFLSENGGENWRSLEGDLPDVPVRWGVFSPGNPEEVVIATEVGIWRTFVNNTPIQWENISGAIGLGRVNMLKYRDSDQQMLAASYGRGLYTTNQFARAGLRFEKSIIEVDIAGVVNDGFCNPVSTETVLIQTNLPFENDANISIMVSDESTAVEGQDFLIENTTALLPQGELSVSFEILLFDNSIIDGDKELILNIESNEEIISDQLSITINENDDLFSLGNVGVPVTIGEGDFPTDNVFRGLFEDSRTQILYTSEYLNESGLKGGRIERMLFEILDKRSTSSYNNLTLSIGHTNQNEINEIDTSTPLTEIFSGNLQVFEGLNIFFLNQPFTYDGNSSLLLEICFDNDAYSGNDLMASTDVGYSALVNIFDDGRTGCLDSGVPNVSTFAPNFVFESFSVSQLYTETNNTLQTTIAEGEIAFMQRNDSILCTVSSLNELSSEFCFSAKLLSGNTNVIQQSNSFWVDRILNVETDITDNGDYELTYFMPLENSEEWDRPQIEALFTDQDLSGSVTPEWERIEIINSERGLGFFSFTVRFAGSGNYTIGIADRTVSTQEPELDFSYDNIEYFDMLGRKVEVEKNRLQQNLPDGIYLKSFFNKNRLVKTEKVFLMQ